MPLIFGVGIAEGQVGKHAGNFHAGPEFGGLFVGQGEDHQRRLLGRLVKPLDGREFFRLRLGDLLGVQVAKGEHDQQRRHQAHHHRRLESLSRRFERLRVA